MSDKRAMLRHFLAAIAYRTQKALRGAPESFGTFQAGQQVRTPADLVRHMTSVLGYARTFFEGGRYGAVALPDLAAEIWRFHAMLEGLSRHLASGTALRGVTEEQLLQGPFADAMTHAGQLALLRRLAGSPVPPENFIEAAIDPVNLGPEQPDPSVRTQHGRKAREDGVRSETSRLLDRARRQTRAIVEEMMYQVERLQRHGKPSPEQPFVSPRANRASHVPRAVIVAGSLWLSVSSPAVAQEPRPGPPLPAPHRFFDAPNVALTGLESGALVVDGIYTQRALAEYPEFFREADPIARPFVSRGWPGQIVGGALFVSAEVGLRYWLHRKNHHRLERLLPLVLTVYGATGAIHGAREIARVEKYR